MLARTFKTAHDLGRTEDEVEALKLALDFFERGEPTHVPNFGFVRDPRRPLPAKGFSMRPHTVNHACGTVACIAGWAHALSGKNVFSEAWFRSLTKSYATKPPSDQDMEIAYLFSGGLQDRTVEEAAIAANGYLTTGKTVWGDGVSAYDFFWNLGRRQQESPFYV